MRRCTALLLLLACGDPPEAPSAGDPEQAAVELLTAHVFDPLDALRPRFTREVNPADFPLRLMLDGPEQYRFVDVWRLRMVDGRLVVWALVELDGAPSAFEMWLEEQDGAWRVAGWSQVPRRVDPSAAAPPAGVRVPTPFAAATFRGAPPAFVVAVEESAAPTEEPPVRVDVKLRAPTFDGDCPRNTLTRKLRGLQRRLGRCYGLAVDPEQPRAGRITFTVLFDGRVGKIDARVTETTLIDGGLDSCIQTVVKALPVTVGRSEVCTAVAPYTFTPRRPKTPSATPRR